MLLHVPSNRHFAPLLFREPHLVTIEEMAGLLAPSGALLGLDLGTKTIGVAVSDAMRRIASPMETIKRKNFRADAERLVALANSRAAIGIVLGLPINMDGTEGPRAQSTRAFAKNLASFTQLPIAFWDERLSTVAVERMLIDAQASRGRRAELVDKAAASWMLQGALDRLAQI